MHSATTLTVIMTFGLTASLVWVVVGHMLKLSLQASIHWAFANALISTGLCFWLLNEINQNPAQHFLSDTLLLIGFCLTRRGLLVFTRQGKKDIEQLLVILFGVASFYCMQDQAMMELKVGIYSSLCAWTFIRCGFETYNHMAKEFSPKVVIFIVFQLAAFFLGFGFRAITNVTELDPSKGGFWLSNSYDGRFLLAIMVVAFAFNVSLAFLVVSRLVLKLKHLSTRDHMTGLYNRRQIQGDMQKLIDDMAKTNKSFSLIMIDLDKFKLINDTRGHGAGDMVLKKVSAVFERIAGKKGRAGRLGGEEFCIVVPDSSNAEARNLAEELRIAVAAEPMEGDEGIFFVTASFGVATCTSFEEGWSNVMKRSDIALYLAKTSGRNRVQMADTTWLRQTEDAPERPPGLRIRDLSKQ